VPREFAGAPQFDDVLRSTARVLDCIRVGGSETRQQIGDLVDLGKAVVSERVRALQAAGVVVEEGQLASGGGRPAKRLRFAAELGYVIAVEVAVTHLRISAADLAGVVGWTEHWPYGMSLGPDVVLGELENRLDDLVHDPQRRGDGVLCGIGVGVAAPVEFATGRVVFPPVHPEWHDQPIRDRLSGRYCVPTWVDNEVNLMALAEARHGAAVGQQHALVVKLGSWVGAGLISDGRLHRGAQGCAGSMATAAGGAAIARQAGQLARSGASPALAAILAAGNEITAEDVATAASRGDSACDRLLQSAAEDVGRVLAVVVDFFNPGLVVVAGGLTEGGDRFLAKLRETLYAGSIALATRDLQVVRSRLADQAATVGAALMTLDMLFALERLEKTLATLHAQAADGVAVS